MFTFQPKKESGKKPLSQVKASEVFNRDFLNKMGKLLLESVVFEAKRDLAKQGQHSADQKHPVGIPRDENFFKSFSYRLAPNFSVEIVSSWPTIEAIVEGKKPYPMKWLTQEKGITKVPFGEVNGKVIIRTTPEQVEDAWIHPGFAKHDFVSRGLERAMPGIEELTFERMTEVLMKSDLLR